VLRVRSIKDRDDVRQETNLDVKGDDVDIKGEHSNPNENSKTTAQNDNKTLEYLRKINDLEEEINRNK
jgi:hypothetical protein